ncbi:MAG: glutamyl-tRNA reductase [Cryomorphaceae bacterium]|jgi:glutamyl-tRNA reductase
MEKLNRFYTIAFNHKRLPLEVVGKFHIDEDNQTRVLTSLKEKLGLEELMFLSTCNRVEFFMVSKQVKTVEDILALGLFNLSEENALMAKSNAEIHFGKDAVRHLYKVTSSLDSMVIGEREIITQVRKSYEFAEATGLTGEFLRLLMMKNIMSAKRVFTETAIFRKPVSVVSIAFHKLKDLNVPSDARMLMIGAGRTNKAMARFLSKHGYKNIAIFNRTESRAKELAAQVGASGYALDQLPNYQEGFDVLIACTGSGNSVVSRDLFDHLCGEETSGKVLIDLAIPADIEASVFDRTDLRLTHINIEELRITAEKNLHERSQEISKCEEIVEEGIAEFEQIHKERVVELAMREIPRKVKEIRENAMSTVYAKEIESLDPQSKEVLNKVISYLEKKYISVPMKMAREVMLNSK